MYTRMVYRGDSMGMKLKAQSLKADIVVGLYLVGAEPPWLPCEPCQSVTCSHW